MTLAAASAHAAATAAHAVAVGVELAAASSGLTDGELRHLPFGYLTLLARQGRANQPTMHGAVVLAGHIAGGVIVAVGFPFGQRLSLHDLACGRGLDRRIVGSIHVHVVG